MKTVYHVTPLATWNRFIKSRGILPRREKRGVYADGGIDGRVYFFEDRDTAEDGMMNWLVDEFPTTRWFAILKIKLPDSYELFEDPELSGSVYGTERIPLMWIQSLEKIDAGDPE